MALVPLLTQSARRMVLALLTCFTVRPCARAAVFRQVRLASSLPTRIRRAYWSSCCWVAMVGSGVERVQYSMGWGRPAPPGGSVFRSEAALQGECFQFLVVVPTVEVPTWALLLITHGVPVILSGHELLVDLSVVGEGVGHGVDPSRTNVVWHGGGGRFNPPCAS
jgi:hypothetical protein